MNGLKEHKYMDFLTTIGYIVLFLIALNLVICFIENVIKEANQKRSEDSSEDNV